MKKSILVVVIITLLTISCKSDKKIETVKVDVVEKTTDVVEKVIEKPVAEAISNIDSDGVKLKIFGNDAMQFNKSELKVKAGQKVTLTLVHTGKMAKNIMGHNFVLLKQGTDIPAFAEKAIAAGVDKEYIPNGDEVIVSTKIIGGGESVTIIFDAPKKGTYDFICSFPGHYGMMKGKFIVE